MIERVMMMGSQWRIAIAALVVIHGLVGCLPCGSVYAQPEGFRKIQASEDSLAKLRYRMYNEPSEPERLEANYTFVKTLVSALKVPHFYAYPCDALDMVAILNAPDNHFQIFSWHIAL